MADHPDSIEALCERLCLDACTLAGKVNRDNHDKVPWSDIILVVEKMRNVLATKRTAA